jgi:ribosomal protein S27E
MPLVDCPHCGAENFTMEGWEDLDRCSSCGKPLAQPAGGSIYAERQTPQVNSTGRGRFQWSKGQNAEKPRRA